RLEKRRRLGGDKDKLSKSYRGVGSPCRRKYQCSASKKTICASWSAPGSQSKTSPKKLSGGHSVGSGVMECKPAEGRALVPSPKKSEPVSDIDTGVVGSLKVLDPAGRLEKPTFSRNGIYRIFASVLLGPKVGRSYYLAPFFN